LAPAKEEFGAWIKASLKSGLMPSFSRRHAFHASAPCFRIWRCSNSR
jgi:hypothetical protein